MHYQRVLRLINIYNSDGQRIIVNPLITKEAVHEEEMMKSNFVKLSWVESTRRTLPAGSYIIPYPELLDASDNPLKFFLLEPYVPVQETTMRFKYEPQFQHSVMWLSKVPFIHLTGNTTSWESATKNYEWTYYGPAGTIAEEIAVFINRWGERDTDFGAVFGDGWHSLVDENLASVANLSFSANDIISAAVAAANAFDCEFHFDFERKEFRFGKVSYVKDGGEPFVLKTGFNVDVANISASKEQYYNRYVVRGGTRNLSKVSESGDNVRVTERLTLSDVYEESAIDLRYDTAALEPHADPDEPMLTGELLYDDIYPKIQLYVYRPRERKCWLLDDDGQRTEDPNGQEDTTDGKKYKYYSKWYIRLAYRTNVQETGKEAVRVETVDGKTYYWYDFPMSDELRIKDTQLSIAFQYNREAHDYTSPLASREFEVEWFSSETHEREEDDIDPNGYTAQAGEYRIVFTEENGFRIPTTAREGMVPKGADFPSTENNIATLFNIVVDDTYKRVAQTELYDIAIKDITKKRLDNNTYSFKSYPVRFRADGTSLYIGQSVVYNDGQDLNGGTAYTIETHVRKLVTNLDNPYKVEISVGNEKIKGTISTMKEQIEILIAGGYGEGSGGGISESQFNTLLKNYGSRYFLSKTSADEAAGEITFLNGIRLGLEKLWGITKDGFATLCNLLVNGGDVEIKQDTTTGEGGNLTVEGDTHLQSTTFGDYHEGESGGAVTVNQDGTVSMQVDFLDVLQAAYFREITIQELKHVGGEIALTAAAMVVSKVERMSIGADISTGQDIYVYKCYFDTEDNSGRKVWQSFEVGDQAKCQQTKFETGTKENVATKYYWRLVVGVGENYITLSDTYGNGNGYDSHTYEILNGAVPEAAIPAVGDNIVMLGHRKQNNETLTQASRRQSAIILSATASNAPSVIYYQGIGSDSTKYWNLEDFVVKREGYYHEGNGAAQFKAFIFGSFYVGDKDKTAPSGAGRGAHFLEFDPVTGLNIQGNVSMSSVQGLEESISDIEDSIAAETGNRFKIWFGETTPYPNENDTTTAANEPADEWITSGTEEEHVQDLYFDRSKNVGSAGRNWRWEAVENGNNTSYLWKEVTDQETIKALELIEDATATLRVLSNRIEAFVTTEDVSDQMLRSGIRLGTRGILVEGDKIEFSSHVVLDTVVTEASDEVACDPDEINVIQTDKEVESEIAQGALRKDPMRSLTIKSVNIPYSTSSADYSPYLSVVNQTVCLPFYDEDVTLWSDDCDIEWNTNNRFGILPIPQGTITNPVSEEDLARYYSYEVQEWTQSGTRLSITCESDLYFGNWQTLLNGTYDNTTINQLVSRAVVVCADARLISNGNAESTRPVVKRGASGSTSNAFFWQPGRMSCGGYVARFIVLLPGQSLQLRSQVLDVPTNEIDGDTGERITRKVLTWVVENASEFVPLTMRDVQLDYYGFSFGLTTPAFAPTAPQEAVMECVLAHPVLNITGTGGETNRDIVIPVIWQ